MIWWGWALGTSKAIPNEMERKWNIKSHRQIIAVSSFFTDATRLSICICWNSFLARSLARSLLLFSVSEHIWPEIHLFLVFFHVCFSSLWICFYYDVCINLIPRTSSSISELRFNGTFASCDANQTKQFFYTWNWWSVPNKLKHARIRNVLEGSQITDIFTQHPHTTRKMFTATEKCENLRKSI